MLGQYIAERHVGRAQVELYNLHAATKGTPPVICTVTTISECVQVMTEWMPDLVVHVLGRPAGTVTMVLAAWAFG